jgi:hypothetical protein|tara:strand:- start:6398 stop:6577 length:180 start_codon:yes stop_codon:yes gene_type:complete
MESDNKSVILEKLKEIRERLLEEISEIKSSEKGWVKNANRAVDSNYDRCVHYFSSMESQ